jgi:hypothetical protein
LISAAISAPGWEFEAGKMTLLATLASLAWLEHWMLILPMRADAPWKFTRTTVVSTASDRA